VVAVDTRRGGDKWHAGLKRSIPRLPHPQLSHCAGIRNETPRGVLSGPLLRDRLYFITALTYSLDKVQSRTLGFPHNEIETGVRKLLHAVSTTFLSTRQILSASVHISPQHTNFVNPDYFNNPQPVTPSLRSAQLHRQGSATITELLRRHVRQFPFPTSASVQTWARKAMRKMILTPEGNTGNYFGRQTRDCAAPGVARDLVARAPSA